jgi:hypothetical protein
MIRFIALLAVALLAMPSWAHKASDAYITIERDGQTLRGQWDIALRDLDNALGLDVDGDGDITWGEVRRRQADIAGYALRRLQISSGGERCVLTPAGQQIDTHTDGAYAVLAFTGGCPQGGPTLSIDYRLFEGLDPQHRGLLNFVENGRSHSVVFSADAPHRIVGGDSGGPLRQFVTYLNEGVWHIWTGFDHILFLLSLLLPAVMTWRASRWQPVQGFKPAFWDVFRIVTSFTVAHSITLSLAALGIVALPSRLVESAIAASVMVAALNNLWPLVQGRRWLVALGFGLIHGFGFASVLTELGLPRDALVLALVGFNLGVECGQLVIVALFLPLAYSLRASRFYRRTVMMGGSLAITGIAGIWLAERLFGFKLLPM